MKFGARQRWLALTTLLTLALTAAAWVRDTGKTQGAEVVEAPARSPRHSSLAPATASPAAADSLRLDKLHAPDLGLHAGDPFVPRSWRKPAAPAKSVVVAPSPPLPPSAPPLPFTYMGKLLSDEASAVFLVQGERNLVVHEGDTIDATYRVDRLSESRLTLTHLPSGIQQTLPIGEPR